MKPSILSKTLAIKTGIAVFTSILLTDMPLRAEDMGEPAHAAADSNQFYAGFVAGSTKFKSDFKVTKGSRIDDSDSGYMIFAGRELGDVEWSGKAGDTFTVGNSRYTVSKDVKVTASGRAVGAAGKYSWNVHRKTRLYAKLGIHSWKTKMRVSSGAAAGATDADGTDAMGGLGVEYAISDRVRILAGSDNYITEDDDVSLTYVGLRFGFN